MGRTFQLLCFCLLVAHANGSLFNFRYKKYISQFMKNNNKLGLAELSVSQEQYFTQPLDHFDSRVKGTLKQRYYVIKDFWKNSTDGPVFLYIGGEGTLGLLEVDGLFKEIAEKVGALIVGAEHRYYGASLNEDSLKLENLQYLSSQQALADLASLHGYITQEYKLGPSTRWVCFGGSYSGALSAWFRIKYPHLIYASVASSAPVRAITNFEAYSDVVSSSLSDTSVGGSPECESNISSAFAEVNQCLKNKSLDVLHKDFTLCSPLKSDNDYAAFISNLADPMSGAVQYNGLSPEYSIANVCKRMTGTTKNSPYQKLVSLAQEFMKSVGESCLASSYEMSVWELNDTTVHKSEPGPGYRPWTYQTCTQFGYFQTCDVNTKCPYSSYLDLDYFASLCKDVFGVALQDINTQVNFTNSYYGSDKPKGTKIYFVNGSIDPWHSLSVLADLSDTEKALYIKGTSHCADMRRTSPDDTPELSQAKKDVEKQVSDWLIEH